MIQYIQKILGINNTQIINVLSGESSLDILPNELEEILDYIINEQGFKSIETNFSDPNIKKKNKLNGVNEDQFLLIRENVPYFEDIENTIIKDNSGNLKKKYMASAELLNTQYLNKFHKRMPEFIIQVIKKYHASGNNQTGKTLQFLKLIHYMYHSCDIGIKP